MAKKERLEFPALDSNAEYKVKYVMQVLKELKLHKLEESKEFDQIAPLMIDFSNDNITDILNEIIEFGMDSILNEDGSYPILANIGVL